MKKLGKKIVAFFQDGEDGSILWLLRQVVVGGKKAFAFVSSALARAIEERERKNKEIKEKME